MNWLIAHWQTIAFVLLLVVPSLITGLSRYPKAAGVVHWLKVALDLLSVVTHADSPGSLKVPVLQRSKSPEGVESPGVPPVALLLILVVGLSACTPRQTIAWQAAGGDALGCLAPGAQGAMAGALDGAIKEATGVGVDWNAYGKSLATTYGGAFALCLVESALKRLGPVIFGATPDGDPRLIFHKLDTDRSWLR